MSENLSRASEQSSREGAPGLLIWIGTIQDLRKEILLILRQSHPDWSDEKCNAIECLHSLETFQFSTLTKWVKENIAGRPIADDEDVVRTMIDSSGHFLEFASERLQGNPALVIKAIRGSGQGELLKYASDALRGCRGFVEAALAVSPEALKFASDDLRVSRSLITIALEQYGGKAFNCAGDALKDDEQFVGGIVERWPLALEFASPRLRASRNIVLRAVTVDGYALQFADPQLQASREVVLAAVTQDGEALRFASELMHGDRDIVMSAMKTAPQALHDASPLLHNDKEIILEAIAHANEEQGNLHDVLDLTGPMILNDEDVAAAAVAKAPHTLRYFSQAIRDVDAIVRCAVQKDGSTLECASKRLQDDVAIVRCAVQQDGIALEYASARLQDDDEIVPLAVASDGIALYSTGQRWRSNRDIVRRAIASERMDGDRIHNRFMRFAGFMIMSPQERRDYLVEMTHPNDRAQLVLSDDVVQQWQQMCSTCDGMMALGAASDELRADAELVMEAVTRNGFALACALGKAREDTGIICAALRSLRSMILEQKIRDTFFKRGTRDLVNTFTMPSSCTDSAVQSLVEELYALLKVD